MTSASSNTTTPERTRWQGALSVFIAAAASVAVFCWSLQVVLLALVGAFSRLHRWPPITAPPAFHQAAVVTATLVAAVAAGAIARRQASSRARAGAAAAALAAGVVATMGAAHVPWLVSIHRSGLTVSILACLAVVGVLVAMAASRIGTGASFGSRVDPLKVHGIALLVIWVTGGFISYPGIYPPLVLAVGASILVLHTRLRLKQPISFDLLGKKALVVTAVFFLLVALRDTLLLCRGTVLGKYASPTYSLADALLIVVVGQLARPGAIALSLGTAAAYGLAASSEHGRWSASKLTPGAVGMMALVPFVFNSNRFQWLPLMLLLLLYTYCVFVNGYGFRRFLLWTVILTAWVPFVGMAQYGWYYAVASQGSSSRLPLWFYLVGSSDPFKWHDSLGTSLAVTLLLAYGLLRTTRRVAERRLLKWALALLFVTFVFTFARGAWISFTVAAAVGAVLMGGRKRWWVPALVAAVAIGFGIAQVRGAVALERVFERRGSTSFRVRTAQGAWEVVRRHPLFGIAPMEWDQRQIERNEEICAMGGTQIGWLQVPVEGGMIGTAALMVMLTTLGLKLRRVIMDAPSPECRLLVQCAVLAIITLAFNNFFDIVFMDEGVVMLPILLGAVLGTRQAWMRSSPMPN